MTSHPDGLSWCTYLMHQSPRVSGVAVFVHLLQGEGTREGTRMVPEEPEGSPSQGCYAYIVLAPCLLVWSKSPKSSTGREPHAACDPASAPIRCCGHISRMFKCISAATKTPEGEKIIQQLLAAVVLCATHTFFGLPLRGRRCRPERVPESTTCCHFD